VPDEVQGSVTGGNGKVELKVGDKSLGIGGKDIVLIIFIILVGAMSYVRTLTLDRGMTELKTGQVTLAAEMHKQNDLVASQTAELRADMEKQNVLLNTNNTTLKQMLLRHDYNMSHEAEQHLPLDLTAPLPTERGR
jgi:hypothetical protein